jgi:spermidine synthase
MDDKPHAALRRTLQQVFSEVHSYRVQIPSFLSAWGFLIASDWFDPEELDAAAIDGAIERRLGSDYLQHATGEFIQASFVLCALTRRRLAEAGPILEDNVAFSIPPETDTDANLPPLRFPLKGRR